MEHLKKGIVKRGVKVIKSNRVGKGIYIIVILISISICLLGIRSNGKKEQQRKIEHIKSTLKDETVKINQLTKQISQFYQNDQEEFLADQIKEDELKDIQLNINTLKTEADDFGVEKKDFTADTSEVRQAKEELVAKIEDIKNKKNIQNQVTALLMQTPTNWAANNEEAIIKESTTAEKILKIRHSVSKAETQWNQAIISLLDEMDAQVKQYKDIEQSIDMMEQDGVLTSNATIENVILIFNQLPQIKNETLKKDLSDKLDVIDTLLEKEETTDSLEEQEEVLGSE